eukprot:TRINITY_DN3794_c0_g1_i2.p1 TRINITY_DN3794_c0_g1~~TRINITY_DN3794_c0_g1_i2.p1  ORF type:complete len:154 (+),score=37.87 TRINITY_DN3794_c0_g1_i2:162-623(+)
MQDPVLIKRLQQLQHEAENRKYGKMVGNIAISKREAEALAANDLKDAWAQMSIGLNIIISIITMFVFGYFVCRYYYGNQALAIIVGALSGIATLMVESVLFVIRGSRLEKEIIQREREEKKQLFSPFGQGRLPSLGAAADLVVNEEKKNDRII